MKYVKPKIWVKDDYRVEYHLAYGKRQCEQCAYHKDEMLYEYFYRDGTVLHLRHICEECFNELWEIYYKWNWKRIDD